MFERLGIARCSGNHSHIVAETIAQAVDGARKFMIAVQQFADVEIERGFCVSRLADEYQ